jgi:hypothetical protein
MQASKPHRLGYPKGIVEKSTPPDIEPQYAQSQSMLPSVQPTPKSTPVIKECRTGLGMSQKPTVDRPVQAYPPLQFPFQPQKLNKGERNKEI